MCIGLTLECILLWILVFFSSLPYFISLFIALIKLAPPYFLIINLIFLFYSLSIKNLELTWGFWRDYLKELGRFFLVSSALTAIVIIASAMLGYVLGISAESVARLSLMKDMQKWVGEHFY